MGKLFTLDADTKSIIADALDDLITELGKECRLYYPPRWKPCANCVYDPVGNKSSNHWRHGGPMPFSNGSACPLCSGAGRRAEEVSETIKLLCAWEPKNFYVPIPGLAMRAPYSIVQTKGYLYQLPKLVSADYMVFQTSMEGVLTRRYRLLSEPGDPSNIIQDRYCVATWERMA